MNLPLLPSSNKKGNVWSVISFTPLPSIFSASLDYFEASLRHGITSVINTLGVSPSTDA